jgi:formylglycine-generating enzyme required for sulfatase activity
MARILSGKPPSPVHVVNPFVPRAVSDLVARALAHRPPDRFPDADALTQALGKLSRLPEQPPVKSWDTSDASGGLVETQPVAELAPLELIPEDTLWERLRPMVPWIIGMGVAVVLCTVGLLVGLLNWEPRAGSSVPAVPNGSIKSPESKRRERPGMVLIEPGFVKMGNREETIRRHLLSLDSIKGNAPLLNMIVDDVSEEPRTPVHIPGFWIDKYEVTNAEYAKFVQEMNHPAPAFWGAKLPPSGTENYPVIYLRHSDALAYAKWAKKQLPTDAQWVKAFRGDQEHLFPWGDQWDPQRANVGENRRFQGASPVAETPEDVTPLGVFNLVGNVGEMMRDPKSRNGQMCVVTRGSSWCFPGATHGIPSRPCYFGPGFEANNFIGFRCVIEAP